MQLDAELLSQLLDGIQSSIFVIDAAGHITYRNHTARGCDAGEQAFRADHNGLRVRLLEAAAEVRVTGKPTVLVLETTSSEDRWLCRLWPLSPPLVGASARQVAREPAAAVATACGLTIAEARLALRVARGMSNQAIASSLDVSVGTINSRLWRLYRRMQVRNRAELASRVAAVLPAT